MCISQRYEVRGFRNPDPALQPLIPLTPEYFALAPSLLLGVNAERNLTVLMNRFPEEKAVYSELSRGREKVSRTRIQNDLSCLGFRYWNGHLPAQREPLEIDLAIVDDRECSCLILELKAFIQPAEPREIVEKSEEIERGVEQIRRVRDAYEANPRAFCDAFGIDAKYDVAFAVASETFIGTPQVQDDAVPVVRTGHVVCKLLSVRSLSAINRWLVSRRYLPVEGRDYAVREIEVQVGKWKLRWYGIKPLMMCQYL
jgi:hypothetical protein